MYFLLLLVFVFSFLLYFRSFFMLSRWSLVDIPIFVSCPADPLSTGWAPSCSTGYNLKARSVDVRNTHTLHNRRSTSNIRALSGEIVSGHNNINRKHGLDVRMLIYEEESRTTRYRRCITAIITGSTWL